MSSDDDEEYMPVSIPKQTKQTAQPVTSESVTDRSGTAGPGITRPPEAGHAVHDTKGLSPPVASNAPTGSSVERSPFDLVRLFQHQNGKSVSCIAVDDDGECLVTGGRDGQLVVWDIKGKVREYNEERDQASEGAASKSAPLRASARQQLLQPTRVITPFINRANFSKQAIAAVSWSVDGSYFVACEDGDCPVTVSRSGKVSDPLPRGQRNLLDLVKTGGHTAAVTCCSTSSEAAKFCTGSLDSTVRVWDTAKLSAGSTYVARHGSGKINEHVQVFGVTYLRPHYAPLLQLETGPASDTPLLSTPVGQNAGNRSAADNKAVVSCGSDGRIQVWDTTVAFRPGHAALQMTTPTATCSFVSSVTMVPSNDFLLAARCSDDCVRFYDLRRLGSTNSSSSSTPGSPAAATQPVVIQTGLPCFGERTGIASTRFLDGSTRVFTVTSTTKLISSLPPCSYLVGFDGKSPTMDVALLQPISSAHGSCLAVNGCSAQVYTGTTDGEVTAFYRETSFEKQIPGVGRWLESWRYMKMKTNRNSGDVGLEAEENRPAKRHPTSS